MEIQKFLFTAAFAVWGLYLIWWIAGEFLVGWKGKDERQYDYRAEFISMALVTLINLVGVWGIAWFLYVT